MYPSAPSSPSPSPDGGRRAVVLSLTNQKGGVGKTTTAVNLGACLADAGAKVLLIDLDPQGNATTGVGVDRAEVKAGAYEVLTGAPIATAIRATEIDNLSLVPSTIDLAGAEVELVSAFAREMKLRQAISAVQSEYDYVLIDSPPSLGLLAVNALAAADHVVVPIQCEYYALEGLSQLMRTLNLIREGLNPALTVGGVVLTMFDARTKLAEQVVAEVRKFFGDVVFRNLIPRSVRLSEAPGYGKPIILYAPGSRAALAYKDLAAEALARWTPALAPAFRRSSAPAGQDALPLGDPVAAVDPADEIREAEAVREESPPPQQQVVIPLPEEADGWMSLLPDDAGSANGARAEVLEETRDETDLGEISSESEMSEAEGDDPAPASLDPMLDESSASEPSEAPQPVVADSGPEPAQPWMNADLETPRSPQHDPVVDAPVEYASAPPEAAGLNSESGEYVPAELPLDLLHGHENGDLDDHSTSTGGGEPGVTLEGDALGLVGDVAEEQPESSGNDSQDAAPAWPPWVVMGATSTSDTMPRESAAALDGGHADAPSHEARAHEDLKGDGRSSNDEDVR